VRVGVSELRNLDKKQLRCHWQQAFGSPPPTRLSQDMLLLALGWQAQAKSGRGYNRETRDRLSRLIDNFKSGKDLMSGAPPAQSKLSPGMSLVREWHGTLHQVQVLDKGFVWNDMVWNSLSAIAREITGARWNGPAFFGLRSKRVTAEKKRT